MVGDVSLWKAITGAVASVLALVGWLWRIDSKAEARTAELRKDLMGHLDSMDSRAEARTAELRKEFMGHLYSMDSKAEARTVELRKDLMGHLDSMDSKVEAVSKGLIGVSERLARMEAKAEMRDKGLTDTVRAATPRSASLRVIPSPDGLRTCRASAV